MENSGWIYFRVVEGRGYCFGKTDSPSRRDSEYRKENPWVEKIYDFFVENMHAVEAELVERTKELRLLENSKEWIRLCDEAREIVDSVREQYALMTYAEWDRMRTEKETAAKERAEQEKAEMRARAALLSRHCPGCDEPMSRNAASAGYKCHRCGIQTL
jgi:phage/plasmid-associated DNA primase